MTATQKPLEGRPLASNLDSQTIVTYYADMTSLMKPGRPLGFHFGLWGPDTTSHKEAMLRAFHTLVQGCALNPGRRVLDAGCGLGDIAVKLAEEFGVCVTGLTNCEPHVAMAAEYAEQRGVGHLVEFRHGDFMDMPFPDACFDTVLNHGSFCYATDKLTYLRGVFRVLRPGGRWQALGEMLNDASSSEAREALHVSVQQNWCMPPLERWRDVLAMLDSVGFEKIEEQNLETEVTPSAEMLRNWWLPVLLMAPVDYWQNPGQPRFLQATVNYAEGLRDGMFTYRFLSGTKPA